MNLTVEILKEIRDEARATNERLDDTNERLTRMGEDLGRRIDVTNERLDALRDGLSARIVASEMRTATAMTDLAATVRELTTTLRAQADLRPRVEQCEQDIRDLKARVPA